MTLPDQGTARTVHKVHLVDPVTTVHWPPTSIVRHVAWQQGFVTVWYERPANGVGLQARTFHLIPTGGRDELLALQYRGTPRSPMPSATARCSSRRRPRSRSPRSSSTTATRAATSSRSSARPWP